MAKNQISSDNFNLLKQGLRDAVNHIQGKRIEGLAAHIPGDIDTKTMRAKLGLSQAAFAQTFGLSVSTLRDWEQGRKSPNKQARVLLLLIARAPEFVMETLRAA
jgi:putative transcriptional regulator